MPSQIHPQLIGVDNIMPGTIPWDPFFYQYKILAEGDSWFSIGGLPASNTLFNTRFNKTAVIVSCAHPGDTIRHMSDLENNLSFRNMLGSYPWNFILMSGGGNDLIDAALDLILDAGQLPAPPADASGYVNGDALKKVLSGITDSWRRIAAARDKEAPGKPIIIHTYDYPTPRDAPARLGPIVLGPWLQPAMTKRHVPEVAWNDLADYLINQLAEALLGLDRGQAEGIADFYVVDTRGTLERAAPGTTRNDADWLNEIHPNAGGYAKIAARLATVTSRFLPV